MCMFLCKLVYLEAASNLGNGKGKRKRDAPLRTGERVHLCMAVAAAAVMV